MVKSPRGIAKESKTPSRNFKLVGASATGASHINKGIPNQDAYYIKVLSEGSDGNTSAKLFCLADGHGSKRCFRSHLGSNMAVLAMAEAFEAHLPKLRTLIGKVDSAALKNGIVGVGQPPMEGLRPLAEMSLKLWVNKVMVHLRENPFQSEEVDALDYAGRRALGSNALLAYGSTLIGVLIFDNIMVGVNLGDGDLMVYTKKQCFHYRHEDSHTIADQTYSLCTSGALAYWHYTVRSLDDVEAVFAATDGYRNSYKNLKGFEQVGTDLIKQSAKKGSQMIEDNWPEWLSETSRYGSGDDITAVIALIDTGKKEKKRLWR